MMLMFAMPILAFIWVYGLGELRCFNLLSKGIINVYVYVCLWKSCQLF
jgi:hypothetical protein